jgi:hypothetical protein
MHRAEGGIEETAESAFNVSKREQLMIWLEPPKEEDHYSISEETAYEDCDRDKTQCDNKE